MADETRHSKALDPQIITDPDKLARKESFNTVAQYRSVEEMIEYFLEPERPFKLRPSHLLRLQREALEGISSYAGNYRPAGIEIGPSRHEPPPAHRVPEPANPHLGCAEIWGTRHPANPWSFWIPSLSVWDWG
jgi:hypothetical protein